ncbi:polymorphic toxin type 15 domain-containing protein [Pseudoalteromonas piscicida]|uniref:polymorphic toxin type 15 domain-containing protein n=1 Tax=Pseudoalteromonas piscicida TaxID=43662 RepID=UPI001CB732BE|nr:polymorphic toxin type 15 domain-containing protein [Pseudoalteromonas piscicida]
MQTRIVVYGTNHPVHVVDFELTTCINSGFLLKANLESQFDLADELLVGNMLTFEIESPDAISTYFTGTLFDIQSGFVSEHTCSAEVVLKPRLELLKQTEKSQIFVQANVQTVLNKLIQKAGYSQDRIKWRVTKDLPTLPQCVQALENDYTFFTRLLAKYGLIYWFECHDFIESIVIAEGNLASPYIERGLLSVTDKDGLVHEHETGFVGFTQCQSRHRFRMGGSQVHMNAHPPTSVSSAQRSYFEPAAHNPAEQFERTGNLELAYQQGKNEVTLVGNVAEANAGYSFSLNGKLGTAKGGDYTCIRSKQVYKQGSANDPKQVAYHSESVCVPRGEPIRIAPPEHSPKPMVFTATVRSLSGSKANPHLDTQGQYATQVHFDSQVTESVKRLTQYACRGQKQPTGLHFPLLPDSNVLIGCMNNDPDQSYLLGFALNDTQPSVVTSANNAQNVLCSRGQNLLMFDDTPNTPHIVLQTLASNQYLVLHGDKKQPYIHWLAQLGAMNIFAAKDIQLGSVKSAIRLLTNKTFIASAKQQLALESKKSVIIDAATNLDVTANQIDVSAKQNLTLKAGRSHRSVIQSDINLKADNNLTITAPAGSQIIQSQGNIAVKGSGSGNLTLANGGSEISIDSSGNVNIFADKLLTLKGKAMTVFDGSMEQDIGGKQSATMPSVPQIQALSENARLSLAADGIATMASSTIELSYTYQDGSPIMGAPYTIRFANGTELTGNLDDSGKAKIENAPPGQYTVQYGEDKRDYLPEDNRPKNPLYGQITPAQAAEMVRSGNTAPLIEANGIATQAGDWLWGTLQGDFNQNPSTSQIVVGTLISMIPIIDQVMDLRDITANVMLLTDDDEANDTDAWLAFTLTGIGLVPVVGSAVKGVGKVILKNTGESLSAALAVLRKLGKGDPVKYLRDINWQDLGKQSATEVKNIVKGLRDSLDDMSTSWHYDLLLPDAAIEGMQATVKRLDDVTPKIDQHIQQAAQEIGQRVNKALDEYQGQSPIRGVTDKPTKAKADELEPPKGNELPGAAIKRMPQYNVPCFKKNAKGTAVEYDRQLKGQMDGLNSMTVKQYLENRDAYKKIGRKGTGKAQKAAREKFKKKLIDKYKLELQESGEYFGEEAVRKAEELAKRDMKTLNALHNPDMIAGGLDEVVDLGDASVNQSIGARWNKKGFDNSGKKTTLSRVELMDNEAEKALKALGPDAKLNMNLHRCK